MKKTRTIPIQAALAGALCAVLVACSSPSSPSPEGESGGGSIDASGRFAGDESIATDRSGSGGTLTIGTTMARIPTTGVYPSDAFEGRRFVGYMVYDGLLNWDLDQPDTPVVPSPGLATAWEVGEDHLTWTLTLRENVKFHDGTDFNADAVVFNLDRMLNPDFEFYDQETAISTGWLTGRVDTYEAIDEYTVQIKSKEPYSLFPWDMALWLIASPTAIETHGNDGYKLHPTGTGPFKVDIYDPGQTLEMIPHTDYWGGTPKLDRLILKAIPDARTRLSALQAGEIQWAETPPPDSVQQLAAEGFNVLLKQYPHTIYFNSNPHETSPASDPLVREAFAYALDREGLCTSLLGGLCDPAYQMAYEGHPWWNEEFGPKYGYDPDKARELLAEAGYEDGLDVKIAYPTSGSGNMWPPQMMEFVQANLADVGIRASLESMEWNQLDTLLNATFYDPAAQEYDFIWGSSGVAVPPNLTNLLPSAIPPDGCCNTMLFDHPGYADGLEAAMLEFDDPDTLNASVAEALGYLAADAQMIYLVHDLNLRVLSSDVRGFVQPQSWFVDLKNVWIKE